MFNWFVNLFKAKDNSALITAIKINMAKMISIKKIFLFAQQIFYNCTDCFSICKACQLFTGGTHYLAHICR